MVGPPPDGLVLLDPRFTGTPAGPALNAPEVQFGAFRVVHLIPRHPHVPDDAPGIAQCVEVLVRESESGDERVEEHAADGVLSFRESIGPLVRLGVVLANQLLNPVVDHGWSEYERLRAAALHPRDIVDVLLDHVDRGVGAARSFQFGPCRVVELVAGHEAAAFLALLALAVHAGLRRRDLFLHPLQTRPRFGGGAGRALANRRGLRHFANLVAHLAAAGGGIK